jgi:L-ascorbate metabolism protein UlaG (beta-lactamase superfamily)
LDIDWYGHACFRIRERGVTVVTDPHPEELGYERPRIRADVVTVSHPHPGHSAVKGFRGSPRVLDAPGEYEIGGVFITGVPTYHDAAGGRELGQNVAFLLDFDGLTVCHLGDLGHSLTEEEVEALGQVNVLLVPVGGANTLGGALAAEVVGTIEPNIVVPMHYATAPLTRELEGVDRFLRAMGAGQVEPQESLRLRSGSFGDTGETQVVVLDYRK